ASPLYGLSTVLLTRRPGRGARFIRGGPGRPGLTGPRHLFPLTGLDRSGINEPVLAVHHLQAAPGEQRPDGPSRGERLGQAHVPRDVRRAHLQRLAGPHPGRHRGEEGVRPLQALLVHAAIVATSGPDRQPVGAAPAPGRGRDLTHSTRPVYTSRWSRWNLRVPAAPSLPPRPRWWISCVRPPRRALGSVGFRRTAT